MRDSLEITYDLSPWARRDVATRENSATSCRRDSRWSRTDAEFAVVLTKCGLPVTEAILDFERNVGGWCVKDAPALWGFGVYLSLDNEPDCHPIARRFRKHISWFASDEARREGPVEWSYLPLRGTGYPRSSFMGRMLVPMGMAG
jgi:hypothetical protein